jgi:hypothetical protein
VAVNLAEDGDRAVGVPHPLAQGFVRRAFGPDDGRSAQGDPKVGVELGKVVQNRGSTRMSDDALWKYPCVVEAARLSDAAVFSGKCCSTQVRFRSSCSFLLDDPLDLVLDGLANLLALKSHDDYHPIDAGAREMIDRIPDQRMVIERRNQFVADDARRPPSCEHDSTNLPHAPRPHRLGPVRGRSAPARRSALKF